MREHFSNDELTDEELVKWFNTRFDAEPLHSEKVWDARGKDRPQAIVINVSFKALATDYEHRIKILRTFRKMLEQLDERLYNDTDYEVCGEGDFPGVFNGWWEFRERGEINSCSGNFGW